jgi:hypothetical protein
MHSPNTLCFEKYSAGDGIQASERLRDRALNSAFTQESFPGLPSQSNDIDFIDEIGYLYFCSY